MKSIGTLLLGILLTFAASAQEPAALRIKHFNLENGVALGGYDPVAYFIENKAIRGKMGYTWIVDGVTYFFNSASNRDEFKKNPSKYEPQYGGWCAYAMGKDGSKVEVDPETFKVLNGKLYVFYNRFFNNTLKDWNKNETNLHKKADENWQRLYR